MNLSPAHQSLLLDVARAAIRAALRVPDPAALPPLPVDGELAQPAGCFVSLHATAGGSLRGCVGRLDADGSLVVTVHAMARAVLEDPRFLADPVSPGELPELDIELSIVSPMSRATSPLDFDLDGHGIYLAHGDRCGCFLPQVARDTGWSKEQLLDRLCTEKLDLPAATWRHPDSTLHRFTALLVGPEPFVK
jgi:AmmeMemoRadiSam system protein A